MKSKMYLVMVLSLLVACAQATLIIDPLADKSLWSEGTASPAKHNVLLDPFSPDDGYLVQDSSGWWAYATNGWNKIVSLEISYVLRTAYESFGYTFVGYDSTGNALPNRVIQFQRYSPENSTYWSWYTVSYNDLSSLNLQYVKIDGNAAPDHAWGLIAGTVKLEVIPEPTTVAMLGLGAVALLRRRNKVE